jgi:DNA mismatch endonuclease (patch repair protein)
VTVYPFPSSAAATATGRGNKRRDTKPELRLGSALHARGLRYRRDLPVTAGDVRVRPDFVFTHARVAVFMDGCFWHGCPEHGQTPKANAAYWRPKLDRNRARDRLVTKSLEHDGWTILRVWEHEPVEEAAEQIAAAVERARREGF